MYPEKHFKEDLQIAKTIQKAAQDVADRWVLAWPNAGYRGAKDVRIDFEKGFIRFTPWIPDGIPWVNEDHKISVEYIVDDSKLESNSKFWYEEDQKKRREKMEYENTLKNDPKVKEYLNLQNRYGSPLFNLTY
jgi:hypothetical protein